MHSMLTTYHVFHVEQQQQTKMFFSEEAAWAHIKSFDDADKYDLYVVGEELPF